MSYDPPVFDDAFLIRSDGDTLIVDFARPLLWLTTTGAPDEVHPSIGILLVFLIPQVAAIIVIALVTRAIRHAAGYGGQRG